MHGPCLPCLQSGGHGGLSSPGTMGGGLHPWWDRLGPQQQQAVYVAAAMLAIVCALGGLFLYAMTDVYRKEKTKASAKKEEAQVCVGHTCDSRPT